MMSGIAEGLIWAAVAAAAMKRYLAHMTQVLHAVEVSTRKVALRLDFTLGPPRRSAMRPVSKYRRPKRVNRARDSPVIFAG